MQVHVLIYMTRAWSHKWHFINFTREPKQKMSIVCSYFVSWLWFLFKAFTPSINILLYFTLILTGARAHQELSYISILTKMSLTPLWLQAFILCSSLSHLKTFAFFMLHFATLAGTLWYQGRRRRFLNTSWRRWEWIYITASQVARV